MQQVKAAMRVRPRIEPAGSVDVPQVTNRATLPCNEVVGELNNRMKDVTNAASISELRLEQARRHRPQQTISNITARRGTAMQAARFRCNACPIQSVEGVKWS